MKNSDVAGSESGGRARTETAENGEVPRPTEQIDRSHPGYQLASFYELGGPVGGAGPKAYVEYCLVVRALASRYGNGIPAGAIKDALSGEAEKEISENGGTSKVPVINDHLRRTQSYVRDAGKIVGMDGPTEYEIGQGVENVFQSLPTEADPQAATDAIEALAEHGNQEELDDLFSRVGSEEDTEEGLGLAEMDGSFDLDPGREYTDDGRAHDDQWLREANAGGGESGIPPSRPVGEDGRDGGEDNSWPGASQKAERSENAENQKTSSPGPHHEPRTAGKEPGNVTCNDPNKGAHHNPSKGRREGKEEGPDTGEGTGRRGRPTRDDQRSPTIGFDNRPPLTPENRRSERFDLISEVDICFVNPPPNGPAEAPNSGGNEAPAEAPVKDRCTREQWGWLTPRARSLQEQWMFLRLVERARAAHYDSGEDEDDGWLVISSEELHEDYGASYPTARVWRGSPVIEVWKSGKYVSPEEAKRKGVEPEARKFRVKQEALDEWTRLGAEGGSRRYKAHRRELVRTRKPQPMTMDLYDENRNDIPGLVKEALEVLMEADHELRIGVIEEAEEQIARREGAEARNQLTDLRLSKEATKRQVVQQQAGVATLQNAYKIQKISGRTSFKKGGPQGLMQAVKAAAYDLEGCRNFDIRSCHTTGMEQTAEMLAEVGVDVSVEPWKQYPGKHEIAAQHNLPVSLVKVVEHCIKYGAVLPCSVEQVKNFYVDDNEDAEKIANWPSVAKDVKKHAEKGLIEDIDETLQTLRSVFKEMREVVVQMAEALLNDYYEAVHSGGWMENACGVSFGKHLYEEGHEQRSKVMAWMLQGLEAAFCHSLTILSADSGAFSVVANEHDGLIIRKDVGSEEAFQEALSAGIEKAREKSGFYLAEFVEKPFADEEDVQALYGDEEEPSEEPAEEHHSADVPAEVPTEGEDAVGGDGAAGEPVLAEAQDEVREGVVREDHAPGGGKIIYHEGMPDSLPDTPDPPTIRLVTAAADLTGPGPAGAKAPTSGRSRFRWAIYPR